MVRTTVATRTFTNAILTRLRSNAEGLDVGDAVAPEVPVPTFPFAVLYPEPSPEVTDEDGTLADPMSHRTLEWQITNVGRSREQAQGCSDVMRAIIHSAPLVVAGRSIWIVNVGSLGEIERDDDVDIGDITGNLFYANDSIEITSSPS
jgi:hypothetical protein